MNSHKCRLQWTSSTLLLTKIPTTICWEKKTSVLQRLTSSAESQWCSTSSRKSSRDFSPVQRWSSFLSASCSRVGMNTLRAQCVSSACQSAEWTPDRWIYCCYRWRHVSLCVDEHLLLTNCDQMRQMDLSRGSALYEELLVTMVRTHTDSLSLKTHTVSEDTHCLTDSEDTHCLIDSEDRNCLTVSEDTHCLTDS